MSRRDDLTPGAIRCQADHDADDGCRFCGGYKEVLVPGKCRCGHLYWVRPGVMTLYEGKKWRTFDGLELTVKGGQSRCPNCLEKKP